MTDEQPRPEHSDTAKDQKPATFTGESRGSSPNTATGLGRGGDVIAQDDIVYGRPLSGRDRAEGDRAPDQESADEAQAEPTVPEGKKKKPDR